MEEQQQNCEVCYRISCRKCNWIASDEDVVKIQCGALTSCPVCGWRPGETV